MIFGAREEKLQLPDMELRYCPQLSSTFGGSLGAVNWHSGGSLRLLTSNFCVENSTIKIRRPKRKTPEILGFRGFYYAFSGFIKTVSNTFLTLGICKGKIGMVCLTNWCYVLVTIQSLDLVPGALSM